MCDLAPLCGPTRLPNRAIRPSWLRLAGPTRALMRDLAPLGSATRPLSGDTPAALLSATMISLIAAFRVDRDRVSSIKCDPRHRAGAMPQRHGQKDSCQLRLDAPPRGQGVEGHEHGRIAAQHGKHIQACSFDCGTEEWHGWRRGYCDGLSSSNASGPLANGQKV